MSTSARELGKREQVLAFLRRGIDNGTFAPNSRLPTRDELSQRFSTSRSVVQDALGVLIREKVVLSRGPQGTFLAPEPLPVRRYGLVFESRPSANQPWWLFWSALHLVGNSLGDGTSCQIKTYYAGGGSRDSEDYQELLHDVLTHSIAGLVFASPPFVLLNTPVLGSPGMPRVCIMAAPNLGIPSVYPDLRSFIGTAMDYLAKRGRRRVSVLWTTLSDSGPHTGWSAEARKRGLVLEPFCLHYFSAATAGAARGVAHVMMRLPRKIRPNGLILADDKLVESACAGIVASGMRVPDDVDVVAHCNYPIPVPDVLSCVRLGFDCHEILTKCLEVIDAQREGQPFPDMTWIPAVFEKEYIARRPLASAGLPLAVAPANIGR